MTITPTSVLRALMTTRTRLVLLLAVCITAAGLLVPAPASAAAPAAAPAASAAAAASAVDAICLTEPERCTPPPMLNKQLLQDPNSVYRATTEQAAALSRFEDEALTNALADHQLPTSEAKAVRGWGRQMVMAQLWALLLKSIRTDPENRSEDQAHAVAWLQTMMTRKARETAVNAGWEYLQWAGRVSSADPRPPADEIIADLQRFANGTLQPVGYMFGTAANSDSGYCDYLPPAGFESQYDGNASRPRNRADQWCFPPYQCLATTTVGCDNRQPAFESFLTWGEADVIGDPNDNKQFAAIAKSVSGDVVFAGAAAGVGFPDLAIKAGLGTGFAAATAAAVALPFVKAALLGLSLTAKYAEFNAVAAAAYTSASAAASVALVVVVAIVAIAIAVTKGIQVAQEAALPGKLRDLVTNALSGTQDLQSMLTDQSDLTGVFGLFIRATGPIPADARCDNTQVALGGPVLAPCDNLTPIPADSVQDNEFLIQALTAQGQPDGPAVRSDTLTWTDTVNVNELQLNGTYLTNKARLSGAWIVTTSTLPDGKSSGEVLTRQISALTTSGDFPQTVLSWPRKQPDGSYKFLTAVTSDPIKAPEGGILVDPGTCLREQVCSVTDSLRVWGPPSETGGTGLLDVRIVPALKAGITVTHSANPQVGEPVTLTATRTGPDVGPLTYKWYVQPASGVIPVCAPTVRFCGYDGPFTGSQIDHTWQGSGTFRVASVVATATGRETVTETTVRVDSTGPRLSFSVFGSGRYSLPWEPFGSIEHAGVTDALRLTIDWGDGEVSESTYYPGQGAVCSTATCPVFTRVSDTVLDYRAAHSYPAPGDYEVQATVRDQAGRLDRRIISWTVQKGPQSLTFSSLGQKQVGDPLFAVVVDGGRAAPSVEVATTTPGVCALSNPTTTRIDGRARTTITVAPVGPGACELRATQDGDDLYDPAQPRAVQFSVVGRSQILDFAALSGRPLGDAPFEVSATGGSSTAPVELSGVTPDICTVSGLTAGRDDQDRATATATVTLLGAGSCTIEASQAGSAGYTAAVPVRRTFEVAKGAQTLAFPAIEDRIVGDAPFAVTAAGGPSTAAVVLSSSTPDVCTLSGATSARVDGRARSSATVTLVAVGTCTITAEQDGDENHLAASPVDRSFSVSQKLAQSLELPEIAEHTYGDAPLPVVVTGGGSSAPVVLTSTTPAVCTLSGSSSSRVDGLARTSATLTVVAAGSCSITASQAGDSGHLAATPVSRSFVVVKAAQTLAFPVIDPATYGDAARSVTVTGGRSTAPVIVSSTTTSVCTVSGATSSRVDGLARTRVDVTPLAAGTCTLQATQAADANTTVAAPVTASFEVERALQPMTFPEIADRRFGSAPFTVTVTGGPAAGQIVLASLTSSVCTISGATSTRVGGLARTTATVRIVAAGTCGIGAAQAGDANRWPGAALRLFTVTRAPLKITAADKTMTWRGAPPAYTASYSGFVNGNTASVVSGLACSARNGSGQVASSTSPVGLYAITCSGATAANYEIAYVPGVLRVVYAFTGFTGLSSTNVNSVRAGSTLSLKWVLKDANGSFVSTSSSFSSVKAVPMTCGGAIPTGGTNVGPGVAGLRYASSTGTWTYDWQTPPSLAGTCQAVTLHLADGSARTLRLRLTT